MSRRHQHQLLPGAAALLMLAAAAAIVSFAEAQSTTDCVEKLVPCYQYLNTSTTPPESCCKPIKDAVATELYCLCKLFNTPGLLQQYRINITQVVTVARGCSVNATTDICTKNITLSPGASPGVPGNEGTGLKIVSTGILCLFLLVWILTIF